MITVSLFAIAALVIHWAIEDHKHISKVNLKVVPWGGLLALFLFFGGTVLVGVGTAQAQPPCPPVPGPAVPDYVTYCPSPIPSNLGGLGIAVDDHGDMFRCVWDNSFHPIPEIIKSSPCGPWTNFPCQDPSGNPVRITALTWDCDNDTLWGAHTQSGVGANVYTVEFQGNIAICHLQFSLAGIGNSTDLAWDLSDQSLWWLSTNGAFPSRVYHISNPLTITGSYNPGGFIYIYDAAQNQIQLEGIAATPAGLWGTRYLSGAIGLYHKSGATPGQFTGTSIATLCNDSRDIENGPNTTPGTCLLWCVEDGYDAHVAYSIPNGDCCQPVSCPVANCPPVPNSGYRFFDDQVTSTICYGQDDNHDLAVDGTTIYLNVHDFGFGPALGIYTNITGGYPPVPMFVYYPSLTAGLVNPPGAPQGAISIQLQQLTWDKDNSVIWAGGLWWDGANWQGHGDIYQVRMNYQALPIPVAECFYQFTVPNMIEGPGGITWDCSDQSLWISDFMGNHVIHVTNQPAWPDFSNTMQLLDAGGTPLDFITGLCAVPGGLYANTFGNNAISFHDKSNGHDLNGSITTSCCGLEGLECDESNFPNCVLWSVDENYEALTAYDILSGTCCLQDTGRCCYCDGNGYTQCEWTTENDCRNTYNGQWDGNLDCSTPCPTISSQITASFMHASFLSCVNGVIVPNLLSISVNLNNNASNPCQNVECLTISGSGPGGSIDMPLGPVWRGSLGGNSLTSVNWQYLVHPDPAGGTIDICIVTTSDCGCTDTLCFSINVPPCPCNYTSRDTEPYNDTYHTSAFMDSVRCGDTLCGNIGVANNVDWYAISIGSPGQELVVDVFGDDTPGYYPFAKLLDPMVTIYHSNGTSVVATNNDFDVPLGNQDSRARACLAPGGYFIKLQGFGGSVGPYLLIADCQSCNFTPPCGPQPCANIPPSASHWWPLDEPTGSTSKDFVGGIDGSWGSTSPPNLPQVVLGQVDQSLCFDGTTSVTNLSPALNMGSNTFSIDCWIKVDNYPSPGRVAAIVGREGFQTRAGYMLYIDAAGFVHGRVSDGVNVADISQGALCGPVPLQTWTMVTLVVNRPSALRLYTGCTPCLRLAPLAGVGSLDPHPSEAPFTFFGIGDSHDLTGFGVPFGYEGFQGCIDEVEMFNKVLSPSQIGAICNASVYGKCKETCAIVQNWVMTATKTRICIEISNKTAFNHTYSWSASGVTPSLPSCPTFIPPTAFVPQMGSVVVGSNSTQKFCFDVTIPPGMSKQNPGCFQVNINSSSAQSLCISGRVATKKLRHRFALQNSYDPPLSVPVYHDSTYTFMLHNDGDSSGVVRYALAVTSQHEHAALVSVNGLLPGETFFDSVAVALGDSVPVEVQLQFAELELVYTYDLNFGSDDDDDGDFEFSEMIGLRTLLPLLLLPPQALVISLGNDGEVHLDWEHEPNAASYSVYASSETDGPWDLLGTTTENNWIDVGALAAQGQRFYYVVANFE